MNDQKLQKLAPTALAAWVVVVRSLLGAAGRRPAGCGRPKICCNKDVVSLPSSDKAAHGSSLRRMRRIPSAMHNLTKSWIAT